MGGILENPEGMVSLGTFNSSGRFGFLDEYPFSVGSLSC